MLKKKTCHQSFENTAHYLKPNMTTLIAFTYVLSFIKYQISTSCISHRQHKHTYLFGFIFSCKYKREKTAANLAWHLTRNRIEHLIKKKMENRVMARLFLTVKVHDSTLLIKELFNSYVNLVKTVLLVRRV